jgi:hypothetical protein
MSGMAFIMKQQAIFLVFFGALFLIFYLKTEKKQSMMDISGKILVFGSGVIIPYLLVLFIIIFTGQFHVFWLWTVKYAAHYERITNPGLIITHFKGSFHLIWSISYYFWILALAGIFVLYWGPYTTIQKLFALLYFGASACAVSTGFYFRPHYYIVILPAVGLLSGIFLEFIATQSLKYTKAINPSYLALLLLILIVSYNILNCRGYYFSYTPAKISSLAYRKMPFNEAVVISKYITENSGDTDKIAILGSEPEICFCTDRRSATGYLHTFPLVEIQPYNEIMQEQMIEEIEKNKPAFLIDCQIPNSWVIQNGAPPTIFKWMVRYIHSCYSPVGIVDCFDDAESKYYWNESIKNRITQSPSYITVYKRNPVINP